MTGDAGLRLRRGGAEDAEAVAALHADSWRRHYRGAYSDLFLDGDVHGDRLRTWTQRLAARDGSTVTILAEDADGALIGFAHVVFDDDPQWGSLLDNLHVTYQHKRGGIGRRLMAEAAREVVAHGPGGFYLWVLEQNVQAQAFYDAMGGRRVERAFAAAPGGNPANLAGTPAKLRYVWAEPGSLRG